MPTYFNEQLYFNEQQQQQQKTINFLAQNNFWAISSESHMTRTITIKAVNLVYLDFQKTFDKVPHKRLMTKVNAHGIKGDTV